MWANAYAERVIGSIRRECLNHFMILNARHLKKTLVAYFRYYHCSRTHLGLGKQCPIERHVRDRGVIVEKPELGAFTIAMTESQREQIYYWRTTGPDTTRFCG